MRKKVFNTITLLALGAVLWSGGQFTMDTIRTTVQGGERKPNILPNVETSFNETVDEPKVAASSYVDDNSLIIGDVSIDEQVFVGPMSVIRGDEGGPIFIGASSNVQDGVVLHALETEEDGKILENHVVKKDGKTYALYIGKEVSIAHQAQIHGPALIGDRVFVGMQAFVFKAEVGDQVIIEPGAKIMGVKIPPSRYVPAGMVLTEQKAADQLPVITEDYKFFGLNQKVVHVNQQLATGYLQRK